MRRNPDRCTPFLALAMLVLAVPAAEAQAYRLDDRAEPLSQAIHLRLDPAKETYSGTAVVEVRLHRASDALLFHAEEMDLDRVALRRADPEGSWTLTPEVGEWGTVTARAGETLEPGEYTLEIDFRQELGTRAVGLYRMEQAGERYLFTQFEADDAREAFPCWDEPGYKIPYQVTVELPAGLEVLSNTPVERATETDGVRTVVFETTPPLPSYLLALAAGSFDAVEVPGTSIPTRVVTPRGQSHLTELAVELTPPLLASLEAYFGRRYPYAKLDLVAVPEFWPGAMENPGAITFADSLLLVDDARATLSDRRSLARVMAHELAHIWFGDLVTLAWWDDLWLNESFADWMANRTVDEVFPELAIAIASQREVEWNLSSDARPSTQAIRKPVESRADVTEDLSLAYGKGREVLGMVERWIGADAFRTGVNRYLAEHAWGNAAAEDLWSALSEAAERDLRPVLAGFLDQPGYPLVIVHVEEGGGEEGGSPRLVLQQERFHNAGVEVAPQRWTVPVHVVVGSAAHAGGAPETVSVLLDRPRVEVPLEARPAWVMPNDDAGGYYRWRIPEAMLLDLAENAAGRLSPVERVHFLGNAGALLDGGWLAGDDYLRVLQAFAEDPEPEVVNALLSGLGVVRYDLVPDDLLPPFRRYVRDTLGPILERYGLEPRDGEDETVSLLRPQLIGWLGGFARDEEVLAFARHQADRFLEDPASVDPAVAGTVLHVAARHGDEALFERLRRHFETAEDPGDRQRLLWAVGAFEAPELRERALAYALEGPLRPNEILSLPRGQAGTEGGAERIARWVMESYDVLAERLPPLYLDSLPWVGGGCSLERLRAVEEFFSAESRRTDGTEATLEKLRDQVHDCVGLRKREGPAVERFLAAWTGGS